MGYIHCSVTYYLINDYSILFKFALIYIIETIMRRSYHELLMNCLFHIVCIRVQYTRLRSYKAIDPHQITKRNNQ